MMCKEREEENRGRGEGGKGGRGEGGKRGREVSKKNGLKWCAGREKRGLGEEEEKGGIQKKSGMCKDCRYSRPAGLHQ